MSDFKYLVHLISNYGRDLQDRLQTYKKINGKTRRHFGKQMTSKKKKKKLRIQNTTAEGKKMNKDWKHRK
jgi:hypothetical protein